MSNTKGYGFVWLFVIVVLGFLLVVPVSLWTDRNLEFYLSLLKGVAVKVPFILSLLLTIILNGVALALNIVFEIIRLCLN